MVSSLIACLCLQTPVINLPAGYYTADDLARELSTGGIRIYASQELENRLYAARLLSCPRADFMKMLEDGLRLRVSRRGGTQYLEEQPEERARRERFRTRLGKELDRFIKGLCNEFLKLHATLPKNSGIRSQPQEAEQGSIKKIALNWMKWREAPLPLASLYWLRKNGASCLFERRYDADTAFPVLVRDRTLPRHARSYYLKLWPIIPANASLNLNDALARYRSITQKTVFRQSIRLDPTYMAVSIRERLDGGEDGDLSGEASIGIPAPLIEACFVKLPGDKADHDAALESWLNSDLKGKAFESEVLLSWANQNNTRMLAEVSLLYNRNYYGKKKMRDLFSNRQIGNELGINVGLRSRQERYLTRRLVPLAVANGLVVRNSSLYWELLEQHPVSLIKNALTRASRESLSIGLNDMVKLARRFSLDEINSLSKYGLGMWPKTGYDAAKLAKLLSLLPSNELKAMAKPFTVIGVEGLAPHNADSIQSIIPPLFDPSRRPSVVLRLNKIEDVCLLITTQQSSEPGVFTMAVELVIAKTPYSGTDRVADYLQYIMKERVGATDVGSLYFRVEGDR